MAFIYSQIQSDPQSVQAYCDYNTFFVVTSIETSYFGGKKKIKFVSK